SARGGMRRFVRHLQNGSAKPLRWRCRDPLPFVSKPRDTPRTQTRARDKACHPYRKSRVESRSSLLRGSRIKKMLLSGDAGAQRLPDESMHTFGRMTIAMGIDDIRAVQRICGLDCRCDCLPFRIAVDYGIRNQPAFLA